MFNEFEATIVNNDRDVKNRNIYYVDLDGDGISEKIRLEQVYPNLIGVIVSQNDKVIDQWNFNGKILDTKFPLCGDIDGDGLNEIFVFAFSNKKILLHCFNPFTNKKLYTDKYVVKYEPFDERLDCGVHSLGFQDNNHDGKKEFYFVTTTAYSVQPRMLFVLDPALDTIYRSQKSNAALTELSSFAIKSNDKNYFVITSDATGNIDSSAPFSDMYAWLMAFENDATFRFPPKMIGHYPSCSFAIPFMTDKENYIVTANIYTGTETKDCTLSLFNSKCEKIKESTFPYSDEWNRPILHYDTIGKPNFFWIIKKNGAVEKLNMNLESLERKNIPAIDCTVFHVLDLDSDGINELIFQSDDHRNIIIARNDFSSYVLLNTTQGGRLQNCSVKLNGNNHSVFFALFDNVAYTILYKTNPLHLAQYPLYAGIYLGILGFLLLLLKAQKHRAELKYETEKRIAELQLKAIKNQLDPHFTLNIINSIGSLFYKQDKEKADYIFGKYSKMLRSTIVNSDKIVTTLSDELDYIQNYLELEKFRCHNRFDWKIEIEEGVNAGINIPKMLIHTFVENAIKHGLKNLEKQGNLLISISSSQNEQTILIADNGIGRHKAKEFSLHSTGKGLQILDQILDLYYNLMNLKITYAVKDTLDRNNTLAGTEVLIKIPALRK